MTGGHDDVDDCAVSYEEDESDERSDSSWQDNSKDVNFHLDQYIAELHSDSDETQIGDGEDFVDDDAGSLWFQNLTEEVCLYAKERRRTQNKRSKQRSLELERVKLK